MLSASVTWVQWALIFEHRKLSPTTLLAGMPDNMKKWVALTRRIAAFERDYHHDDPTLVRHVDDLDAIKQADKIGDTFLNMSTTKNNIETEDTFHFSPEYREFFGALKNRIQTSRFQTAKFELCFNEKRPTYGPSEILNVSRSLFRLVIMRSVFWVKGAFSDTYKDHSYEWDKRK